MVKVKLRKSHSYLSSLYWDVWATGVPSAAVTLMPVTPSTAL